MKKLKGKGVKLITGGYEETYYIFTGKKYTPFGHCFDRGEYYEIAKWSFYVRIDKETFAVISNRVDVDLYVPDTLYTAKVVKIEEN